MAKTFQQWEARPSGWLWAAQVASTAPRAIWTASERGGNLFSRCADRLLKIKDLACPRAGFLARFGRQSRTLRHPAWEFTDFLPLSFGRVEPTCRSKPPRPMAAGLAPAERSGPETRDDTSESETAFPSTGSQRKHKEGYGSW